MRRLTKSKDEFTQNTGYSGNLFYDHYQLIEPELQKHSIIVSYGRTVMSFAKDKKFLKAYVHHGQRSREFLTFTDIKGKELATFHCTAQTDIILKFILEFFEK